MLADIGRLAVILRILGECLLISILPGRALRTLVDIAVSKPSMLNLISNVANLVFYLLVY